MSSRDDIHARILARLARERRERQQQKLKQAAFDMASDHPQVKKEAAAHRRFPEMYDGFAKATLDLIEQKYPHLSPWLVAGFVRYNVMSEREYDPHLKAGDDAAYKLPNGRIAIWSRKFILSHPEHVDVFDIRPLLHEAPTASVDGGDA